MEQQDTLLIACGSLSSRNQLRTVLQERYNLLEATNTLQTLLLLEQNLNCIAAVVLDISNWDVIDQELLLSEDSARLLKQVPVIIIDDKESYQDLTVYFHYGAADVIPLNYEPYAMLRRIETITQLSFQSRHMEAVISQQSESLRNFSDNMVDALSTIIEYRSLESGQHVLRIRNFTRILLEEVMHHCPEYGLTNRIVSIIASASVLHDVGKISIPDAILSKPGPLTESEWKIMQTHAARGCDILDGLYTTIDQEYLQYARNICRYHHERWDGKGYPDGLKEESIPICAQIVGLTDCYDALTSKRVYKEACSHSRAVNMILSGECGAFSPKLLECFKNVTEQFDQLSREYADGKDPTETITDLTLPAPDHKGLPVNLLEKTQAKYFAMVHYLNALLVEIQLDTGVFQVIYNPYPDLAQFKGAQTLRELTDIAAQKIVIPEEEERMYQVIWEELPKFIQQDLRRQSFYFHHRPYDQEPGGPFEMTFLRTGSVNGTPRSSLAILCRKAAAPQGYSFRNSSIMENFTECTYVCKNDSSFTLVRAGRDTHSLGGYTPAEVMEIFGGRLLDMAFPEDRKAIRQEFDRQLKSSPMVRTEYRFVCKDGSIGWVVNKSRLVIGDDGQEYIQTFLIDITDSKTAYDRLNEKMQRYEIILAQTENVLFELDVINSRLTLSNTWKQIFGYIPSSSKFSQQLSGETHVHPDDIPLLLDRLGHMEHESNYEMVEIRIATIKGRYLWCRVRGSASRDENGKLIGILGLIINIDAEKQAQLALEDKANRDSLTQLLNKEAGRQQVQRYLSLRIREPKCALLLLDLDNFKEVNDRYGHLFGDSLLTQVSRILTSLFHSQDIVARIGGDEFMVLVRGITDRQLLASQCRRLRDMLVHAFQNAAIEFGMGCSIGIALSPEHGSDYYELFNKADLALYQAKSNGKNDFCFYSNQVESNYFPTHRLSTPIDSDKEPSLAKNDIAYQVFRVLYQAEDTYHAISQALAMIGKRTNVSRVYVFESSEDNSACSNTFEWCNDDIPSVFQNYQDAKYKAAVLAHRNSFDEDGLFYCPDTKELTPHAAALSEALGIKSMLHCAIRQHGTFRGYIGFDECSSNRMWTKEEIQVLTYFSEILSMFLLKYREQERAKAQAEELRTILENQNQWNYILDPKTYELQYVNGKARIRNPNAQIGKPCYQSLLGKTAPCEDCPVAKLQNNDSAWSIIQDSRYHLRILTEATRIKWQNRDCCLMTCRRLPDPNPGE